MAMPPLQQYQKGANKAKTPPGKRAKAIPSGVDPNLDKNRMGMVRKKKPAKLMGREKLAMGG
jgi:hypothetical protein